MSKVALFNMQFNKGNSRTWGIRSAQPFHFEIARSYFRSLFMGNQQFSDLGSSLPACGHCPAGSCRIKVADRTRINTNDDQVVDSGRRTKTASVIISPNELSKCIKDILHTPIHTYIYIFYWSVDVSRTMPTSSCKSKKERKGLCCPLMRVAAW